MSAVAQLARSPQVRIVVPRRAKIPCRLPHLLDLISGYLQANLRYLNPGQAHGECWESSARFGQQLQLAGIPCKIRRICFCPRPLACEMAEFGHHEHGADFPIEPPSYALDHRFVQTGNLCIDFTARQFDPQSPFPLLWVESE